MSFKPRLLWTAKLEGGCIAMGYDFTPPKDLTLKKDRFVSASVYLPINKKDKNDDRDPKQ